MGTIADSITEYNSGTIICPSCQTFCKDTFAKAIFEPMSGIVIGYLLDCPQCKKQDFLNLLGKLPLFDLSGRYSLSNQKDG